MANAWALSFLALILIGFTVDYFGKLQPMFFFTLGAIGWIKLPYLNHYMTKLSWLKNVKKARNR
jgi:hypothetical protein